MVTAEKVEPNWKNGFVRQNFAGRFGQTIYKKYFNVIPEKQHQRFRLVDEN